MKHAGDHVKEVTREKRRKSGPQASSSHYLSRKHSTQRVKDYDEATSEEDGLSYAGSSFDFDKFDNEERQIYKQIKVEDELKAKKDFLEQ